MPPSNDSVLALSGALDVQRVTTLAIDTLVSPTVTEISLAHVEHVDSTGLALLAELVSRIENCRGHRPRVTGTPAGYAALCKAYRINPDLSDFP